MATRQSKEEVAVDEGIEVGEFVMTFFDLFFFTIQRHAEI